MSEFVPEFSRRLYPNSFLDCFKSNFNFSFNFILTKFLRIAYTCSRYMLNENPLNEYYLILKVRRDFVDTIIKAY